VLSDTWELIVDPFFDRGGIDKGLFWHMSASLQRVAFGYALAAVAGVLLGTLVGQSTWAMRGLDPIFQVLRTVPPLAWLPLSLAAFRNGQPSAIFVIFITAIWPIIINTAVGIRNIPQDYRNVAQVLRLNQFEFFFKIMVPAAAPYIFTGLRIGIGLSVARHRRGRDADRRRRHRLLHLGCWNSSHISEIILALIYVGLVGFILDRIVAPSPPSSPAAPPPTEEIAMTLPISRSITSTRLHARLDRDRGAARTSRSASRRANTSRSSATPAAARARCSTSSPACCRSRPAACCWRTRRSTIRARIAPWCSRTIRCCPGSPSTTTSSSRSTRCSPAPSRGRAPRLGHAQSRPRADGARQGQAPGGDLRRHEAARRLARALAMEPKVLLLDEPFGALDALTRAHLQDSVMAIHQKLGNTVLMITHDVDEAVLLSDRIVMMTNGPAAHIGENPRRAAHPPAQAPRARRRCDLPEVAPARARVPLRASITSSKPPDRAGPESIMSGDFSPEQKRYLEGFTSGLQIARAGRGLNGGKPAGPPFRPVPMPSTSRRRTARRGGRQAQRPGKFKRESIRSTPTRALRSRAGNNAPPKPGDKFRWRYYGLFYVAPAQDSVHVPAARYRTASVKQLAAVGLADLAVRYGGGYSHVTTRANFQIREIEPKNAGRCSKRSRNSASASRGTGATTILNVTGTPTAGHRSAGTADTSALRAASGTSTSSTSAGSTACRASSTSPFDGAGIIPVLEDTNDIGFQAVEVKDGFGVEPGVWFKLALGGITGHKDFARDTGVIVKPATPPRWPDAIVRVFSDHGDRTNRNKARMKYVLDAMGFDKYLALVEEKLGSKLFARSAEALARAPRSIAAPISACISRSRRACTGSASCCRSASSPSRK
jgi:nitrate ABC transporter permease subunit